MSHNEAADWTPGPWVASPSLREDGPLRVWWVDGPDGQDLAIIPAGREPAPNVRANATLMAAAPDLYLALVRLVDHYNRLILSGDCGFWDPTKEGPVLDAYAAIGKARGETLSTSVERAAKEEGE